MYDAAEEARKRKLDQDAKDRMALKEFESMGRGKAELRRRENAEERLFIQEEIDREEREEELKRNFDNLFFYKGALDRLHAANPTRTYDENVLKILWATTSELTTTGYERLVKQKQRREALQKVETTVVLPPPAPTHPPSSHIDGGKTWPANPSFVFMNGIRDDDERVAYGLWAAGNIPQGHKHLVPQPDVEKDPVLQKEAELPSVAPTVLAAEIEADVPPPAASVPVVLDKTTVPTPLPAVPLQKELLVSATIDDAPKAPDLTKCGDPMKVVQKYKSYFRVQDQRTGKACVLSPQRSKQLFRRFGLSLF